ncbi:hypothetical protein TRFO_15690 [Tritrichomonas foetus]|uniref:AIR9-like A9 domain-containing protein n=1 Tax=Tritrichomonas foetus TaxID=1144522 RepID=A0A1J4KT23_9EUKA|nr:hypothetical protein TRFO_15690 [Tritrichomonas foetus]|eukprot:OHT14032.1 hypothetical protein TRFO_15690 [Tritrichomonas foetus]
MMKKKSNSPSKIPVSSPHRTSNQSSPTKSPMQNHSFNNSERNNDSSKKSVSQSPISDTKSFRTHISILDTVEDKVDPNIKEQKLRNRLNEIMNESPASSKDAVSSTLLYLELGPLSMSHFSLNQISQRLLVLKLTNTKLESPNIPYIEPLRTLFLDNCSLTSLVGFPQLPKLRYLSLANNKIKTFKGLPVCPELEEFDIRENAIDFPVEISLEAIASVSLNTYNGQKITEANINDAFSKSPLIGVALRQGLPVFDVSLPNDEVTDFANKFLIHGLLKAIEKEGIKTTNLILNEQAATITLPIKGKNIRWFINTQPNIKKPQEWEPLKDSSESLRKTACRRQILNITQMMYQHLIKCEFSFPDDPKNKKYSMYTLNVVGSDRDLILPFPINPKVTGDPYEGSLVSLVPMPVPCHVSWYLEDQLIDQNVNSIRLKDTYIDHEVTCLLQPYCRYQPNITFTRLLTKTDTVMRLNPIVTNLNFPEDIIEGSEFRLKCLVLPKREGNSEIAIEKAISPSGNWEHVVTLQPFHMVYTPTFDDVGYYLRIKYLPILNDGTRPLNDKPTYFYSRSRVVPGLPEFSSPMIAGEPKSGHSLVAIANYFGGKKGQCSYRWYISSKKFDASVSFRRQRGVEDLNITTATIELTKPFVGHYVGVEMIPVRDDDTVGNKITAVLPYPIEAGERLTPIRSVPNDVVAYTNINVKMSVIWYRTNPEWRDSNGTITGFEKILAGPEYTPTDRDVGCFLRLMTNDGKSDMIIGEVQPSVPFIYNFSLNVESSKVGSTAEVPPEVFSDHYNDNLLRVPKGALKEYGYHRKVEIVWVRITKGGPANDQNGYVERVIDIDTPKYTFTNDDIGSRIKAVVYPLDDCGKRRNPTHSEPTAKIRPFKYDTPIMTGELRVDEALSIDFNAPIYSITWERTKKIRWAPIQTFTFHHFEDGQPIYQLDTNNKNLYSSIDYQVSNDDIDYLIQAEIIVGEIKEITDQDGNKVMTMVAKDMHAPLKTSSKTPSTSGLRERVIPKDLHIYLNENVSDEPITDGQTVTVEVDGADSSGKKAEIVWEALRTDNTWEIRSKGLSYTFTTDDIDYTYRIRCKNTGETIDLGVIDPALPSITPFTISQDAEGSIVISGFKYSGGFEGKSKFVYSFMSDDSSSLLVRNVRKVVKVDNVRKFTPTRDMFNRRIDIGYIPVRRDNVDGKCTWSSGSIVVKPIPLLDAFINYPDNLVVGSSLSCVIKRCTMKASYRYTWRRFIPSPEDEDVFEKENVGDGESYILTQKDNGCYLVCQVVAVAENGFVSPIFVLDSYQIVFPEQKGYILSISVPARTQADVKSTKRSSDSLSRSIKAEGEVDTGDILKPVLEPTPKRGLDIEYQWQIKEDDEEDDVVQWTTVSALDDYIVSILDLGRMIRCVCTINGKVSDEIESLPIGPVKLNPKIEALARAVIRANSLKVRGKAPTGNGQWELSLATKGLTVVSRQGNEQFVKWSSVVCTPLRDEVDQIEITTGPASRIIIVPELIDARMAKNIPEAEVRDFCVYVLNQYKKNCGTSPKK